MVMDLLHDVMSSPWIYPAIFAIALIDGFFPAVPSETTVITAGVFAASVGYPNLAGVIAVAALGAFAGDHVSYLIGRTAGGRFQDRKPVRWAAGALAERGGLLLVVARYIPGGRTAATLATGIVHYPLRKFTFFDALAASSWGVYSALIGYVGGRAFENDPIKGLLLGLGIALSVTAIVELVRYSRKNSRKRSGENSQEKELVPS